MKYFKLVLVLCLLYLVVLNSWFVGWEKGYSIGYKTKEAELVLKDLTFKQQ